MCRGSIIPGNKTTLNGNKGMFELEANITILLNFYPHPYPSFSNLSDDLTTTFLTHDVVHLSNNKLKIT
jgi:hypothetical protein